MATAPARLRDVAQFASRMNVALGTRLGRELFAAPALDMLLDLYLRAERRPTSLTSLCGATAVPARTALNVINRLVARGLLERSPDPQDGRRVHVALSASGIEMLNGCFEALLLPLQNWCRSTDRLA